MKIAALALLAGLAGCSSSSSNPTHADGAHQIGRAVCAKFSACFASDFSASYKSVDDCATETYDALPAADKTETDLSCSRGELDTCTSDYSGIACPASVQELGSAEPDSCRRCN